MRSYRGFYIAAFIVIALSITGCTLANVEVNVTSERTALENQVLGTYNSLDREMMLVASVRGVDASGNIESPPPKSADHESAMIAMRVISFNRDDIELMKRLGWVGERKDGLLECFDIRREPPPAELSEYASSITEQEFDAIVKDVNNAREIIMKRVIDLNEDLSMDDMDSVRAVFGKLNIDSARPGEMVQSPDGAWVKKQ